MTHTTVSIRPMHPGDVDQVQAIDRISFSLPWPTSAYQYELNENPASLLWVAVAQTIDGAQRVIGVIVIWLILDEAHIATLAVHPDYRRQGVAQRLLATALRSAIKKNMRLATLEVRDHNLAAQNLYQSFGFKIVGHRPRYYRDNFEDALIMTVGQLDDSYLDWLQGKYPDPTKTAPICGIQDHHHVSAIDLQSHEKYDPRKTSELGGKA